MKSIASAPKSSQCFYTATGMKQCVADRLMYFSRFLSSATMPGPATAESRWLEACVLGQVKFHTKQRPFDYYGTSDEP